MLRKVMMSFCFLMSASFLAASGSVMTLDFTKGTFVNHENPSSTSGKFKLLAGTAGVHDFARRLILDFKSKEAILTKPNDKVCFGNFRQSEDNKAELHVSFSKDDTRNVRCHNDNFTIESPNFTDDKKAITGQKFSAVVRNVLFLGQVRAYFLKRIF